MASMNAATEQNNSKINFSQAQWDTLQKIEGFNKEHIHEHIEMFQQTYPDGHITEKQFLEMCTISLSNVEKNTSKLAKRIFAAVDRNNSETVDFCEYILAMALTKKNDPEIQMKYLFALCDCDRNGLLSKGEVVDILKMFMLLRQGEKNVNSAQLESELEKFNLFVDKAFGDKTQVSLDEFRQICAKNEELKTIAGTLQPMLLIALSWEAQEENL